MLGRREIKIRKMYETCNEFIKFYIYLFTAIWLLPGGSIYFTCKQNMKLVTTRMKLVTTIESCKMKLNMPRKRLSQLTELLKCSAGSASSFLSYHYKPAYLPIYKYLLRYLPTHPPIYLPTYNHPSA